MYKTIRNIAIAGILAGLSGIGYSFCDYDRAYQARESFLKDPKASAISEVRDIERRIIDLEFAKFHIERAKVHDFPHGLAEDVVLHPDYQPLFKEFISRYDKITNDTINEFTQRVSSLFEQRDQVMATEKYKDALPEFRRIGTEMDISLIILVVSELGAIGSGALLGGAFYYRSLKRQKQAEITSSLPQTDKC